MTSPHHEDDAVSRLMAAPLEEQATTMLDWGMHPAGLLILMSPCEGRCFFCAQAAVTHPPPSDWTQWTRIEALLTANRSAGLTHLCIGGTEPTTHPDFARALQLARFQGFETIELMTSGLALSEPGTAARWRAAGIETIACPIYSADPDTHDQVVGVQSHQRLIAGIDAAVKAGIGVRMHTLALRRTLPGLKSLFILCRERWGASLTLAPARPKDGVWDYASEAAGLDEVAAALEPLPRGAVHLTGWPDCMAPDHPRFAAQVIDLYFRGQVRGFGEPCRSCKSHSDCPGVVQALLARDKDAGLTAR